uniref:Probable G-protein coupled receptor CG31760 n=1 Tax=Culex pipiens TaxID=7175 RepID=A0A8D8GLQ4_CULPI
MVARFFEESENVRTRTRQWRSWISVIFRVRSAKAVKITDAYLLKRLGLLCGFVGIALLVRTLVAPPVVIVGRTADNLKAFLCKTDWWDHTFTSMEVLFLAWGVRLCIMVRKAPSEFNESRFISMAIYNEFLLTCFLNVSMLFLQSPANPDLLYIIFFCHTQLTVTLLLGLIFGSKVYLVFRGGGKHQDDSTGLGIKPSGAKFISRTHNRGFANASSVTTSTAQLGGNIVNEGRLTEEEATEEIKQLYNQLQRLYDRIPQRGTAIATLAALMETCKNVSLKPPPTVVPKAIMPAPQENGLIRVDKSTNTNSIPNGKFESNTRITITDDSDHHLNNNNNNHRSIDNSSNFNLDSLQLKCMCSEEEVLDGEPKCECHKGGAAEVPSCTNTVRSSCKSSVCCDSGRREQEQEEPGGERSKSLLVKRNSELMLNSSSNSSCCRDGSGRNGSARHPASGGASCSSKFSELCPKNFESCDNLLHQQQKQRQKQTSCGDSIDNHSNRRPLPGESGLVTTASSLSVDENNFRNVNLENFNKLYASHNNKIDSLKENFLMRTALTTALHNLENENRSRGQRNTHGEPSAAASSCQCSTVPNPSCSTCGRPSSSAAATVPSAGNSASESISSADASSSATATEANGGSTGRDPAKKKKSPEKRLVIDLNDRSKYTEEVSV